jgi:hypothetical protein
MNIISGLLIFFLAAKLSSLIILPFDQSNVGEHPVVRYIQIIAALLNSCELLVIGLLYSATSRKEPLRYFISAIPKLFIPVFEEVVIFVALQTWFRDLYQVSLTMMVVIHIRLINSMGYVVILIMPSQYGDFLRFYEMFIKTSNVYDSLEELNSENSIDAPEHFRINSIAKLTREWFSRSNPSGIEIKNDDESQLAVLDEKLDNTIDSRHGYLRFVEFMEQQDDFRDYEKMILDRVFARFGVLTTDINSVWMFLEAFNVMLLSIISILTYHYFGIASLLIIIAVRLFRETYMYDQKVNIDYKIAFPTESVVLVVVAYLYYVSSH